MRIGSPTMPNVGAEISSSRRSPRSGSPTIKDMRRAKLAEPCAVGRRIGGLAIGDHNDAANAIARTSRQRIFDHRRDHACRPGRRALRARARQGPVRATSRSAIASPAARAASRRPASAKAFALIDDDQRHVVGGFTRFAHPLRLHQAEKQQRQARARARSARRRRARHKRPSQARRARRARSSALHGSAGSKPMRAAADHRRSSPRRSSSAGTCTWSAL